MRKIKVEPCVACCKRRYFHASLTNFLLYTYRAFGQNTIHVTVAGVVATWWIAPEEANSCCSASIFDSLKRSLTTSFGSICFGSLLVAIIQALRALANTARSQDDGILLCLAECILACIAGLIEYFNKVIFYDQRMALCPLVLLQSTN